MERLEGFDPIEIEQYAANFVRAGFMTREEIIAALLDWFDGTMDEGRLRPLAVQATDNAIKDQRCAEREWPALTDCDRLDLAFDKLEDSGIVARQNFTCCRTCGHAEIGEEIEAAIARGAAVRGYAFYHRQDTERAAEGGGLHLAYGALTPGEDALLAIAREIVAALKSCGLNAEWNGVARQTIGVSLDWRRRFPDS